MINLSSKFNDLETKFRIIYGPEVDGREEIVSFCSRANQLAGEIEDSQTWERISDYYPFDLQASSYAFLTRLSQVTSGEAEDFYQQITDNVTHLLMRQEFQRQQLERELTNILKLAYNALSNSYQRLLEGEGDCYKLMNNHYRKLTLLHQLEDIVGTIKYLDLPENKWKNQLSFLPEKVVDGLFERTDPENPLSSLFSDEQKEAPHVREALERKINELADDMSDFDVFLLAAEPDPNKLEELLAEELETTVVPVEEIEAEEIRDDVRQAAQGLEAILGEKGGTRPRQLVDALRPEFSRDDIRRAISYRWHQGELKLVSKANILYYHNQ